MSKKEFLDEKERKFLNERNVPTFRPIYDEEATLRNLVGFSDGFKQKLIRPILWRMVRSNGERRNPQPLSYIFMGPPGTGKSATSRVLSNTLDGKFKTLNLPQILSKWVGEAESNFKDFLQKSLEEAIACRPKPLIIRVEEAEILLRSKKEFFNQTDNDGYKDILPLLLSHLAGDYFSDVYSDVNLLWIFNVNEKDVVGKALKSRSMPFKFPLPDSKISTKLFIYGSVGKGYCVKNYRDIDWQKLGGTASQDELSHREIIRACDIAKANAILSKLKDKEEQDLLDIVKKPQLCKEVGENYTINENHLTEGLKDVIRQKTLSE